MSVLAFEHSSPSLDWRLPALLKRFLAPVAATGSLAPSLTNLPDHLLLDIGLDPRNAPISLHEAIARPDLVNGGVVVASRRTSAKS